MGVPMQNAFQSDDNTCTYESPSAVFLKRGDGVSIDLDVESAFGQVASIKVYDSNHLLIVGGRPPLSFQLKPSDDGFYIIATFQASSPGGGWIGYTVIPSVEHKALVSGTLTGWSNAGTILVKAQGVYTQLIISTPFEIA